MLGFIVLVLLAAIMGSGCAYLQRNNPGGALTLTSPGVVETLQNSAESRFALRLVGCLEGKDFAGYHGLHVAGIPASGEVFDLLADLEPGDFVRMESQFSRDEKSIAEMNIWLVVKEAKETSTTPNQPVAVPTAGSPADGAECNAEFVIAGSYVRYILVAAGGEWKIKSVEEFGEE